MNELVMLGCEVRCLCNGLNVEVVNKGFETQNRVDGDEGSNWIILMDESNAQIWLVPFDWLELLPSEHHEQCPIKCLIGKRGLGFKIEVDVE